jgi:hypothetical protein
MSKKSMPAVALVTISSLLATGACAHTVHHSTPLPPLADGDEVSVTTSTGTGDVLVLPGRATTAGPTAFRSVGGQPIDDERVRGVTVTSRDHGRGAGEGAVIGLGVGALAGMAFGLSAAESTTCGDDDLACGLVDIFADAGVAAYSLMGGALIGTVTGAVLGGTIGHRRYDVYEASPVPQVGVAPTAGGVQASAAWRF